DAGRGNPRLVHERDNLNSAQGSSGGPAAPHARRSALAYLRALPRRRQLGVALASTALVGGCFVRFGLSGHALVGAIFAAALVLLTAIDLDRRLLPDAIVLPILAVVLVLQIAFHPDHTLEWVLAALGAAFFFFIPMLIYPAGMGM